MRLSPPQNGVFGVQTGAAQVASPLTVVQSAPGQLDEATQLDPAVLQVWTWVPSVLQRVEPGSQRSGGGSQLAPEGLSVHEFCAQVAILTQAAPSARHS